MKLKIGQEWYLVITTTIYGWVDRGDYHEFIYNL